MNFDQIINFLGVLIAIIAGMYVTSIHSAKTRKTYIKSLKADIEAGEYFYYSLIQNILRKAQDIFGSTISQQSIVLAITWALLYSSIVFMVSWFIFGVQKIGNAEVTTITINPSLRFPVGLLFLLSIFLVILFFKSNTHEVIKKFIEKIVLKFYKRTAIFINKNASILFPNTLAKKIKIIIDNWAYSYKQRFRYEVADTKFDADKKIKDFKQNFLKNTEEHSILAILYKKDPATITIAGFDKTGKFNNVSVQDCQHEISYLLTSKPVNKKRFIELATNLLEFELLEFTIWGGFFSTLISGFVFLIFTGTFVIGSWFFSSAVAISLYISASALFVIYLFKKGNDDLAQWFVRGIILSLVISSFLAMTGDYSVLLFVFIFPLANGIFDWMSINLSRYFGHLIIIKKKAIYTFSLIVLDLAFAYIFLAGISMILAYSAESANLAYNNPTTKPFPIDEIITTLKEFPFSQGFWLLFMLFSTLVPTYIHLSISSFHLMFLKTPEKIKSSIIQNLQSDGPYGISVLFFTIYRTISLIAPFLLFYFLFALHIFASDSIATSVLLLVHWAADFAKLN